MNNAQINAEQNKISGIIEKMSNRPGELILEELIEQGFRIFASKLAHKGIAAMTEYAFQFELGVILKTLGQLYEFRLEDKFQLDFEKVMIIQQEGSNKKSRVDIMITYILNEKTTTAAIELKFFKKANHREPNNRYDVFKDVAKLEKYRDNGISLCYFLLITDHDHYVRKENYADDTKDFDFRHDVHYKTGTILSYRTQTPYGQDIVLANDYHFNWKELSGLYFLKLKV